MEPSGDTNVPEGMAWGWRVVSGGEPFTEGRPDDEKGNDKVVIVLTDGANTYADLGSTDDAGNKSTYCGLWLCRQEVCHVGTDDRVFQGHEQRDQQDRLLERQLHQGAERADAEGLRQRQDGRRAGDDGVARSQRIEHLREEAQIDALEGLLLGIPVPQGTDGKPAKLFWNATGATLAEKFKEIADELSNLRIVG